jgi:quercetin dioxygenase-like cupin family protein
MKHLLIITAVIALASAAVAQQAGNMTTVRPEGITWKDHPALPKGAQFATLMGDPTKSGEMYVQRIKLPANFRVPPHTHPNAEITTVISGGITVEMEGGSKGDMFKPGTFYAIPPKHVHHASTGGEETILQIQSIGPAGIEYVNPADDPRKTR